jgi:hypothetical protein
VLWCTWCTIAKHQNISSCPSRSRDSYSMHAHWCARLALRFPVFRIPDPPSSPVRSTHTAQLATRRRCARSTPDSSCTALPVTRCGASTGDAAGGSSAAVQPSRRVALRLLPSLALAPHLAASLLPLVAAVPPAVAAQGAPSGFNAVKDTGKGYAFFYPIGWQEVALDGQDKAFKDVIEPLESVSLSVLPTNRASLAEAGSPQEVAQALVAKSASPQAKTALVSASQVRLC